MKCVTTVRPQGTVKGQEAWTLSSLRILKETGFGPIIYWHANRYMPKTLWNMCIYSIAVLKTVLHAAWCVCFDILQSTTGFDAKENQVRLKSLLSKNALRFALKAGELLFGTEWNYLLKQLSYNHKKIKKYKCFTLYWSINVQVRSFFQFSIEWHTFVLLEGRTASNFLQN